MVVSDKILLMLLYLVFISIFGVDVLCYYFSLTKSIASSESLFISN